MKIGLDMRCFSQGKISDKISPTMAKRNFKRTHKLFGEPALKTPSYRQRAAVTQHDHLNRVGALQPAIRNGANEMSDMAGKTVR
jgi:hypothetical protein